MTTPIYRIIRRALKDSGSNKYQAHKKTGISLGTLNRITEKGANPCVETLEAFAEAIDAELIIEFRPRNKGAK